MSTQENEVWNRAAFGGGTAQHAGDKKRVSTTIKRTSWKPRPMNCREVRWRCSRARQDQFVTKNFKLTADQMVSLVHGIGASMASDRITVDGCKVGYCYREAPDFAGDSGWRFFAGDETQAYADTPGNFEIYDVNTIANYDPGIISVLGHPSPVTFERAPDGLLRRV